MKKKPLLVLLDANAIIHRAYHAMPDFTSSKGEPTGALFGLIAMIIKMADILKPDYVVACFDLPKPTHRHKMFAEYKAHRKKTDDALSVQLSSSREVLKAFSIPIIDAEGFEADDLLGTIAEKMCDEVNIIIASGDMDTMQLVKDENIRVFTLKKGIHDTILYNEKAVFKRFGFAPKSIPDYKGLTGDPSDNIQGIEGIGDTTAQKLISTYASIDVLYKKLRKDGLEKVSKESGVRAKVLEKVLDGEEDAQFSRMLATIRKDVPIVFALPKKVWREELDVHSVLVLCDRLEFKSLVPKVKNLVSGGSAIAMSVVRDDERDLFSVVQIMCALVSPDSARATLEDVFRLTNSDSLAMATKILEKEIKDRNLDEVFEHIEKPLAPIIKRLNASGIKLDCVYLKNLSCEYNSELNRIKARIIDMAGEDFNINSPKQLGKILFEKMEIGGKIKKTATGQLSTSEDTLYKLRNTNEIIPEILSYRSLQKLLSTYIDALPPLVSKDGRIRPEFIQMGAATGRMSCKNPNLQNIPVQSVDGARIRNAFVAERGKVLVSLDYSQIELRIAAILSKDEKLINDFASKKDIHTATAARVFCVSLESVTKEMRRKAKAINFGILYGMGINALRQALGEDTTQDEARKFLEKYFAEYQGVASWIDKVKAEAKRLGYTQTLFGRRRYFSGFDSELPQIRAQAERMAINAPVQGTAADVIKIAMVECDAYIEKENLRESVVLCLQVHDELVYEIAKEKSDLVVPALKKIMENVLRSKSSEVQILVDVAEGGDWGNLH